MERRGCGLGCIIAGLGLLLSVCLMPYLVSSMYALTSTLLQVPAAPNWLWGDWLNTMVGESELLYMLMAEGPMCCVGAIGLLIVILGLVLMINGLGQNDEYESEEEVESGQVYADEEW
jgi:hypothetical protein